jgi:hypothetical protein
MIIITHKFGDQIKKIEVLPYEDDFEPTEERLTNKLLEINSPKMYKYLSSLR